MELRLIKIAFLYWSHSDLLFTFLLRGLGTDEDNNSSIVIKFAKPGPTAKLLDNEYRHYLLLDAEGSEILVFFSIICQRFKLRHVNRKSGKDQIYEVTIHSDICWL